jgi:hypothetical protein
MGVTGHPRPSPPLAREPGYRQTEAIIDPQIGDAKRVTLEAHDREPHERLVEAQHRQTAWQNRLPDFDSPSFRASSLEEAIEVP